MVERPRRQNFLSSIMKNRMEYLIFCDDVKPFVSYFCDNFDNNSNAEINNFTIFSNVDTKDLIFSLVGVRNLFCSDETSINLKLCKSQKANAHMSGRVDRLVRVFIGRICLQNRFIKMRMINIST